MMTGTLALSMITPSFSAIAAPSDAMNDQEISASEIGEITFEISTDDSADKEQSKDDNESSDKAKTEVKEDAEDNNANNTEKPKNGISVKSTKQDEDADDVEDEEDEEDEFDEDAYQEELALKYEAQNAFAKERQEQIDKILSYFEADMGSMDLVSLENHIYGLLTTINPATVDDFIISYYKASNEKPKEGDLVIKEDGKVYFYTDNGIGLTYNYPAKGSRVRLTIEDTDEIYTYDENVANSTFKVMKVMRNDEMVKEIIETKNIPALLPKNTDMSAYNYSKVSTVIPNTADLQLGDAKYDASAGCMVFYIGEGKEIYNIGNDQYTTRTWQHDSADTIWRYEKEDCITEVINRTAKYGDTLGSIALPDKFEWCDKADTRITQVGSDVTYKLKYTPDNTAMYNIAYPMAHINVTKKSMSEVETPTAISGTYDYNPKYSLIKYDLPDDWAWKDGNIIPTPQTRTYTAVFTPENPNGYEDYDPSKKLTAEVGLTIVKANLLDEKLCLTFDVKAGTKLSQITLGTRNDGKFSWNGGDRTLSDEGIFNGYTLKFVPNKLDFYNVQEVKTLIRVTKDGASQGSNNNNGGSDTNTNITSLTATFGQKLSDITLPSGWSWSSPNTSVGSVGSHIYSAITGGKVVNVQVEVLKAKAATVIKPTPQKLTYSKGITTGSIILPSHWSFKENKALEIGEHEYAIVYTPTDSESYDYSEQALDTTMTITVAKATPEFVYPSGITIKSGKTLTDSLLPKSSSGVYSWTSDTSEAITKSGTYYCKFTPNDSEHYLIVKDIGAAVTVTSSDDDSSNSSSSSGSKTTTNGKSNTASDKNNDNSSDSSKTTTATRTTTTTASTNTASATQTAKKVDSTTSKSTDSATKTATVAENKSTGDIKIEKTNSTEERELKIRPVTVATTEESTATASTELIKEGDESTEEGEAEEEEAPKQEEKSSPIVPIIIILLLGGAGAGGYFFYKKMTSENNEDTL